MDLPTARCESSAGILQHSPFGTAYRVWCAAYHCIRAAVTTSGGYSYLGSLVTVRCLSSSHTALMASPRSGSDSATFGDGRDVTNPVRTLAPFSYTMFESLRITQQRSSNEPNAVSDGQNRKNGMPRSR